MRPGILKTAWALALVVGFAACRCGSGPAASKDAAYYDGGLDGHTDAQPPGDAAPDAQGRDAWADASPCDATFIELPPDGLSYISVVSNWGRWVAYDYDENEGDPYSRADIYLYDLQTCTEHRITNEPTLMQWQPWVWDGRVVFGNDLDQYGNGVLVGYDISTSTFTNLFFATSIACLGSMGNFVAYAARPDGQPSASHNWYLLQIDSGQSTLLQTTEDGASSGGDMSETHFTWPSLVMNEHEGIHVVELATGQQQIIQDSIMSTYPTTWGDWVVWENWDTGLPDIWGVRLGAGERVHVTDNGAYNGYPRLREHLLCFRTTLWAGGMGWDIAIMDMNTWVVRRVTETTHPGYSCAHAHAGWLVYRKQVRQNYIGWDKIYAVNLVAAGILDDQGRVIPE
ncbi:MAG: hypothetical protein RBU30_14600 [Polyangia bacterium]|nr:hypothetical protein [Polyangia bacterium]